MRHGGTPLVVVDAGNLFRRSPGLDEAERAERETKARLIAEATKLGGVDAMLPGRGDFAFGRAFVEAVAEEFDLPYVLSNVDCADALPWPASREVTAGGARVVIYGVASPKLSLPGCTVRPAAEALAAIPQDDTVVVVLSDLDRGTDLDLVKTAKGIDLVVRGDSIEQLASPTPLGNGGLLVSSGTRGKLLGVLRVELHPGAPVWRTASDLELRAADVDAASAKLTELADRKARTDDPKQIERLDRQVEFWTKKQADAKVKLDAAAADSGPANEVENELRALGTDVGEHPATQARVEAVKAQLAAAAPASASPPPTDPSRTTGFGPYVGSGACRACHTEETTQWVQTAHSRAWPSLVAQTRQFDRDCFTCHVTGALDPLGPKDPRALGGLENVGCEACHGAGREHARDPKAAHLVASPPVSQCVLCHDSRQDGGRFDAASYLPKVRHGPKKP